MIAFPNAKINIGLNVVEKRPDGFHNIETVFYPIPWCDALEIIPSEKVKFESAGLPVPGKPEENLCLKAYYLLKEKHELPPVHIFLLKNIPMGAGLGGGSSDAAFMLQLLNKRFELQLTAEQLQKYAAQLGSDCAFFVKNKPAYATERGDKIEEIEINLDDYRIIVVFPGIHVSTAAAFQSLQPMSSQTSFKEAVQRPVKEWKNTIKNDFEPVVFKKYPQIEEVKETLYSAGAVFTSMSGSGSAVYGIFERNYELSPVVNKFRELGYRVRLNGNNTCDSICDIKHFP